MTLLRKTLTFEIITPLYMGGADAAFRDAGQTTEHSAERALLGRDARVRVRPVVAMWRYWFRAIVGAVADASQVRSKESALFGGIGTESRASLVRIVRVTQNAAVSDEFSRTDQARGKRYGTYLGYGLGFRNNRGALVEHARYGLTPLNAAGGVSTFEVELICDSDTWRTLEQVINVWSLFGGLGARHRRGFGSIRWVKDGLDERAFAGNGRADPATYQELQSRLKQAIDTAKTAVVGKAVGAQTGAAQHNGYDTLDASSCTIKPVDRVFSSYDDALTAIKNQLRIDVRPDERPEEIRLLENAAAAERARGRADRSVVYPTPPAPPLCLGNDGFGWRQRWSIAPVFRLTTPTGRWFPYYIGRDHDVVSSARRGRVGPRDVVANVVFGAPVAYSTWHTTVKTMAGTEERRKPSPVSFRVIRVNQGYRVLVIHFVSRVVPVGCRIDVNGTTVPAPRDESDLIRFMHCCDGTEIDLG